MGYTLTCQTCHHKYNMEYMGNGDWIKPPIVNVKCNWCPKCEDRAEGYYEEWADDNDQDILNPPTPIPDNQLMMPFIFDEIGAKKQIKVTQ